MTLDELRSLLASPEAWLVIHSAIGNWHRAQPDPTAAVLLDRAIDAHCDERARTIAQALDADAAVQRDRDAAVLALLDVLTETGGRGCQCSLCVAADRVRAFYPEGK